MKISIITPALNAESTIQGTLESVLAQGGDVEHVLVDGGSTDGTLTVVRRYERPGLVWSSEPDGGIADAFNRGIERATGEVIGIINADDELWPGALGLVRAAFEADPEADVVYGDMVYEDPVTHRTTVSRAEPDLRAIVRHLPLRHPSTFVRRSAYERYGVFDRSYRYAMDYELVLRFHLAGARFVYLPHVLARMRGGGVGARRFRESIAESRRIRERYGYPESSIYPASVAAMAKTFLRLAIERVGLSHAITLYRRLSPRFGSVSEAPAASPRGSSSSDRAAKRSR